MNHFTRVEDFSNGMLADRQRMQFLQDLGTDPELAKEYRLSQAIDNAISDVNTRNFEAVLGTARKAYERRKSYTLIYRAAASFALLAMIGGSVLFYMNAQPSGLDKVTAQYYEVYQPLNGMRGADPVKNLAIKSAFDAYSKKDYTAAVQQFGAIAKSNPSNMQARFYQACALMETGASKQALTLFSAIITTNDNFYTPLSEYYLGMCYLKTGDKESAIRQFEKVASRQGGYQAKAGKILNDLRSL